MNTDSVLLPILVILVYLFAIYALAWILWNLYHHFRNNLDRILFRTRMLLRHIPIDDRQRRKIRMVSEKMLHPNLRQPEFWMEYARTALLFILLGMIILGLLLQ